MKKMAISALLLSTCFASTAFAAESPTRSVGIGCTPAQNSDRETIHDRGLVKPSSAPEGSSGYRLQVKAAHTRNYMVTTANPLASAAGCRVLAEGGNAADAAVAVLAVLGLVEPQSSGIGGGAFALYFDARTGEISTYDGRDTVPAAATENYRLCCKNSDGGEGALLGLDHAAFSSRFCASIATTSVSALGPIPKARSTMRASPRMSPVKLKMAAWPLRNARITSKPLIVA